MYACNVDETTVHRTQTYYSSVILCSIRTEYYNIQTGTLKSLLSVF